MEPACVVVSWQDWTLMPTIGAREPLRIDGRKTGHQRCLPLPETVMRCLEAYLPLRQNQLEQIGLIDERALLISRIGKRLSSFAISNGVHTISRSAQVSDAQPSSVSSYVCIGPA